MNGYKGIPTWSTIWRTAKELEKTSVANYNSKNGTNFRSLYQIIDYIYSDANIIQEFNKRYTLFDVVQKDLDKVYNDLFDDPIIQLALFTDIVDKDGPLGKIQATGKQINTGKFFETLEGMKFTHFRNEIVKKANTYFQHLAVKEYNDRNKLRGKNKVGLEILKGHDKSKIPLTTLLKFDRGVLIELIIIDTMAEIHGYGEGKVLKSRKTNAPFDFSVFDMPMEAKNTLLPEFRYMEQAPSQVAQQSLKVMKEQAIAYYKQNRFDEKEYKRAFIRALVDYKLKESQGATFITMNKDNTQYLLASDFIDDLKAHDGEPIMGRGTHLNMDDIEAVLKKIREEAKEEGLRPIHFKHVDKNVLWYGNQNGKVKSVKQLHI